MTPTGQHEFYTLSLPVETKNSPPLQHKNITNEIKFVNLIIKN